MASGRLRVLIIGGYGTFGGRLARLLSDEPRLTLVLAGRSFAKAECFCKALTGAAVFQAAAFDRDGDVLRQLDALKPDLVVDASGPFQTLGPMPYRVVEACVTLVIPYLDLADGADFVRGIARFDEAAKARDVFILSGLSTFPALSFAVLRRLTKDLTDVRHITAGVAPSPAAGVGLSVIRAIASYAGRRVALVRDGKPSTGVGLGETRRLVIAPPGQIPLGSRRFSLVDVPDLTLAAARFPHLRSIWVGAGTLPAILHRALNVLAWLVRLGLLPRLDPLAGLFHRANSRLRWGEHRGGLMLAVDGLASSGERVSRSWHLIAEGDTGPLVPCFPAEAVVRALLDGRRPPNGARPATEALDLDDLEGLFARHRIVTGTREDNAATRSLPLYPRVLGTSWAGLPASLRALHGAAGTRHFEGRAEVDSGRGWLARILARVIGFPESGGDVPVSVTFETRDGVETWRRSFAGRRFSSRQSMGRGRSRHLVDESFGPVTVALGLLVTEGRLKIVVRRWSILGLPLPLWLAPGGDTFEFEADGRFNFHVEITTPLTGLVVRYRGWLRPA